MKKLHLICNAHLDPVWMWDWDEGAAAALSTFFSAVELASEYDYIFCHNEVILYEYIEKYEPELFEKIKKLVEEGKWHIMGGWYLQPDCLTPSGESYIRQISLGREYFSNKFGKRPTTAVNFDSFGHDRGMVQVLNKCGYDSYIVCRPMPSLLPLPSNPFYWKGFDGSEIKVLRGDDITIYCTGLGTAKEDILRKAKQFENDDVGCILWGVGNHGGGPSRKDLSDILELIDEKKGEYRIIHSVPEDYFKEVEPKATLDKSLTPCFPKSISSISRIKQKHAELENRLFSVEKACSIASIRGDYKYNILSFREAEKALSSIEFHDVLSGTCTKDGEISSIRKADYALEILNEEFLKAYFAGANKFPRVKENEHPFIIYNFQPYERDGVVETEILFPDSIVSDTEHYELHMYQNGVEIPCQAIKEKSNINYDRRKRVIYKPHLSSLGFSEVILKGERKPIINNFIDGGEENITYKDEYKTLVFSRKTGLLESYKAGEKEYLSSGAGLPIAFLDNEDPWGWNMKELGKKLYKFHPIKKGSGPFSNLPSFRIVEHGPVMDEIESLFEYGKSYAKVSYKIYHHTPYIDMNVLIYWNEQNKGVKLAFPTLSGSYFAQEAYGTDTFKPNGEENPSHRFIGVGKEDCFVILNKDAYGSSKKGKVLYQTLFNGSAYCAHPIDDRPLLKDKRHHNFIEQGMHEYSFRLAVTKRNEIESLSDEFIAPPYSLNVYPHGDGDIDKEAISLSNKTVTLASFRKSSKEGYIIRLFNNSPRKETTKLSLCEICKDISLKGYEFKTYLFLNNKISEISDASIY